MLTAEDLPTIEERLAQMEVLIKEGSNLIDEQVRLIKHAQTVGHDIADADHTLEIMIELQASHIIHRQRLIAEMSVSGDSSHVDPPLSPAKDTKFRP